MAKNSEDYWRKREEEQRKHNIKDEQEFRKELEKMYRATLKEVNDQIYAFYAKYASQNAITMAEAKRRADKLDIEAYAEKAKRYVKEKNFSEQANKEMRIYNLTMKANRLELLKAEIGLELCANADEIDDFMREELEGRTLNEIERQAGILGKSIQDNRKFAQTLVNASFHNATFSDRIWANQALLRNELSNILTTALIQGRNPRDFISQVRKRFDVSTNNAYRLLVTELARVQTSAQMESFKRNGFNQYTFLALGTACEICRKIDGKHFDVDKANAGINMPPMHPNCRCSTSAYMDDDEYNAWLDSYKDHGVTWDEWKKISVQESLQQHKTGEKVLITDQAIDKIKAIRPKGYTDEAIANTLARRKELLQYAKEQNNSDEVVSIAHIKNNNFTNFVKGNRDSVDFLRDTDTFHMLISSEDRSLELIHNHPGLSYFSLNDINVFMTYPSIKTMSIITNQGKTWYINKLGNFDFSKAQETMKELINQYSDLDDIVEKFLKKGYTFGVERN